VSLTVVTADDADRRAVGADADGAAARAAIRRRPSRIERRRAHFSLAFVGRAGKVTGEFLSALAAAW
jgi:hypothetical protein